MASSSISLAFVLALAALPTAATAQLPDLFESRGSYGGDVFGAAVAAAGDFDGDCFPDFIVGSPGHAANGVSPVVGRAVVYSGRDGSRIAEFLGEQTDGRDPGFGRSVSGVGDIDRDGYDDVAVGAPSGGAGTRPRGYVRVYSGRTLQPLINVLGREGSMFGWAVSRAGDYNGDGYPDIVVGAPRNTLSNTSLFFDEWGAVFVLSGEHLARLAVGATPTTDLTLLGLTGGRRGARLGRSVFGPLDVDANGIDDFLVGAEGSIALPPVVPGAPSQVWVVSGRTGNVIHSVTAPYADQLGHSVDRAGDVDGDGHEDFVASAPGRGGAGGSAEVYSGATGAGLVTFRGSGAQGEAVVAAVGVGDLDGDRLGDVVIGEAAYGAPTQDPDGRITAFGGRSRTRLWQRVGSIGSNFGSALCDAGDLQRSSGPHLIVGAPTQWSFLTQPGKAHVLGFPQPWLGSGDELYLTSAVGTEPLTAQAQRPVRFLSDLVVGVHSPRSDAHGQFVLIGAQIFPTGFPPTRNALFPYLAIDPADPLFFPFFFTPHLGPGGFIVATRIPRLSPPVLSATWSLRLQALSPTGRCAVPGVAVTNAHEFELRLL